MTRLLDKEMTRQLDMMVNLLTIGDMESRFTTDKAGETAIVMLDRFSASKGFKQETLAHRLGVSRQTVSSRFRKRSMTLQDFIDTCVALDVSPSEVISQAMRLHDASSPPVPVSVSPVVAA